MNAPLTPLPPAVELTDVSCRFSGCTALRPVSLRVDAGTTCLVHGPNGSGKTTLLRVCAGVLVPSGGVRRASGRCLYLRPGSGTRRRQTVLDALRVPHALSGRPGGRPGGRSGGQLGGQAGMDVDEAVEVAQLRPFAARRVETLSSGQRSRLVIAIALVTNASMVCLDEPTAHLDEEGMAVVRAGVRQLAAAGTAVLVATHDRELLADPDARLLMMHGLVRDNGCSGVR